MKRRFVQIEGELVEVGANYVPLPQADHHVMPDFEPFVDNTGTLIKGRAQYREHLKSRDAIELGHSDFPKDPTQWHNPVTRKMPDAGRKDAIILATQMKKSGRSNAEIRTYLDNVTAAHKRR